VEKKKVMKKQRRSNEKVRERIDPGYLTIGGSKMAELKGRDNRMSCCIKKVGGKKHNVFLDLL
jgi:hypothetical protein